jgi:hypothetical protein
MPDAMITVRFADGRDLTTIVDRNDPQAQLVARSGAPEVFEYLPIGIEHILLGPDHLLFVLGLLLVVRAGGSGLRMLVAALTAFTVAHSLTLALSVLGIWGLPPKAVEVLIALSIVVLALELARDAAGGASTLTLRKPWLVAFAFGLLHGFGFAGALREVGLPDQAIGWALLLFNVGVEIGQLMFVAAVLLLLGALRRVSFSAPSWNSLAVTLLGGLAMFWTLDRLLLWL